MHFKRVSIQNGFKKCVFHLEYVSVTWEFTLAKTLIILRVLNAGDFTLISFIRKF